MAGSLIYGLDLNGKGIIYFSLVCMPRGFGEKREVIRVPGECGGDGEFQGWRLERKKGAWRRGERSLWKSTCRKEDARWSGEGARDEGSSRDFEMERQVIQVGSVIKADEKCQPDASSSVSGEQRGGLTSHLVNEIRIKREIWPKKQKCL